MTILIMISAGYLFVLGLIIAAIGVLAMVHDPKMAISALIILPESLILLSISLGVFFKKFWARIALNVLSVFSILIGLIVSIGIMFALFSATMTKQGALNQSILAAFLFGAVVLLIVLPILFLFLFNGKTAKAYFIRSPQSNTLFNQAPLGIKLLWLHYILGVCGIGIIALVPMLSSMPMFLGPIVLSPLAKAVYMAALMFFNLYLVMNVLRLKRSVWPIMMGFHVMSAVVVFASIFITVQLLSLITMQNTPEPPILLYRIMLLPSVAFSGFILWYVNSKKNVFVN